MVPSGLNSLPQKSQLSAPWNFNSLVSRSNSRSNSYSWIMDEGMLGFFQKDRRNVVEPWFKAYCLMYIKTTSSAHPVELIMYSLHPSFMLHSRLLFNRLWARSRSSRSSQILYYNPNSSRISTSPKSDKFGFPQLLIPFVQPSFLTPLFCYQLDILSPDSFSR